MTQCLMMVRAYLEMINHDQVTDFCVQDDIREAI